ncbi:helix-turn-helix domain-containing protein [Streptomyces lunaelactis]|uniref:helix-turn-helix domain-containing protein n=1 Tax=Streptomyces lunaelactis TaxID=1535768 RepID=UPI0035A16533
MQLHEEPTIGDRVARLRMRRKLTQEGLAERAGLSVDVVRKLEQGVRQTARLTTLNALARVLDVEPSTLVGQPTTFEVRTDDEQPRDGCGCTGWGRPGERSLSIAAAAVARSGGATVLPVLRRPR